MLEVDPSTMASQPTPPPNIDPPEIRPYPSVSLNKALLTRYIWGGTSGRGRLTSHDSIIMWLYLKKAGTNQQVMQRPAA